MGNKADRRRRWLGGIFLGGSILMLIAGETVLSRRLSESAWMMVIYWLLCFLAVVGAMIIALLDLSVLRRRTREEQRGLLSETLNEIAKEKEARIKNARPKE